MAAKFTAKRVVLVPNSEFPKRVDPGQGHVTPRQTLYTPLDTILMRIIRFGVHFVVEKFVHIHFGPKRAAFCAKTAG